MLGTIIAIVIAVVILVWREKAHGRRLRDCNDACRRAQAEVLELEDERQTSATGQKGSDSDPRTRPERT